MEKVSEMKPNGPTTFNIAEEGISTAELALVDLALMEFYCVVTALSSVK